MIKNTWAVREIIPLKNCAQGTIGVGVKGFGGGPFKDRIEGQTTLIPLGTGFTTSLILHFGIQQ